MATDVIDTLSYPEQSSSRGRCTAHELNAEQRQQLAVQVLARTESVTDLAGRHQVSRQFLYRQATQGAQALAQAFAPQAKDEEVLFYLPVTKAWLRQVVLGLVARVSQLISGRDHLLSGPARLPPVAG
jgi:transposase-like protein